MSIRWGFSRACLWAVGSVSSLSSCCLPFKWSDKLAVWCHYRAVYLSVGFYLCRSHTSPLPLRLSLYFSLLSHQQSSGRQLPIIYPSQLNKQAVGARVHPPAVLSEETAAVLSQTTEGAGGSRWRGCHAMSLMDPEVSEPTWLEWGPSAAAVATSPCEW